MAHTMSHHRREQLERAWREAEVGKYRATDEAIREDGGAVIEAWNARIAAGMPMLASPLIGPAVAAGYPYLRCYCPGRRTERTLDLRTIDRHPFGESRA